MTQMTADNNSNMTNNSYLWDKCFIKQKSHDRKRLNHEP